MLQQKTLADIIREKVPLGLENSRGFFAVKCAACGDYHYAVGAEQKLADWKARR